MSNSQQSSAGIQPFPDHIGLHLNWEMAVGQRRTNPLAHRHFEKCIGSKGGQINRHDHPVAPHAMPQSIGNGMTL